ncbi:cellulase [Rhodoblastus acidophilus]|uniref:cellulase n=1 Tax=Candidatus Rhodoblastus alkanivorans TaxID=2954117 RepID=A0ABS9Z5I9_9HYPH|nr:glycosyl hydrolase family 8 [Candidatus Rhodoblastus alkanivorans]MCI4678433.1 cellulase [Candidatus Rhodoblastus alkanivorans]MCI4682894.1 cellulase [Candidatus Rhodoblastus alkanivorans]MDI4640203.1 cellulase [Rhodoblastus acidophilus]
MRPRIAHTLYFIGLLLVAGAAPAQAPAQTPSAAPAATAERLDLDASERKLGGSLASPDLWARYKARFITQSGRVVDYANGAISHSEGQGYGMLLAVAANDHEAFDRIWGFTRANMMTREDQLIAWRWDPRSRPPVTDMNDASDGDILVAWGLTEAADYWGDESYRVAARRIAVEIGRKLLLVGGEAGPLLLPAVAGFAKEDRPDGPVLNLSYWVFPAFERLPQVAPEVDWNGLIQSGLTLIKAARVGPAHLPPDWISEQNGRWEPATGFARAFSYNAIRIPLYMAMAGVGDRATFAPFVALWAQDPALGPVNLDDGRRGAPFGDRDYDAIAELTLCATRKTPLNPMFFTAATNANYYPATLHLLAIVAAHLRYASCSKS